MRQEKLYLKSLIARNFIHNFKNKKRNKNQSKFFLISEIFSVIFRNLKKVILRCLNDRKTIKAFNCKLESFKQNDLLLIKLERLHVVLSIQTMYT